MGRDTDSSRYDAWARLHNERGTTDLIPAATVVVLRDGGDGLEVLMLRRNSEIAFGGMWVFPGGRIDEADAVAGGDGRTDELATASAAAAREAAEEADIAVDPGSLVWFSHWLPPPISPKRYSTYFFATRAAGGADGEVAVDEGEITDHAWMSPLEAINSRDRGEIELAPPTWMTLHLLGSWDSAATALGALADMDPVFYETAMARIEGGVVAMWDGDAGYDTVDPSARGPRHRLTMTAASYRLERTMDPAPDPTP